MRSGIACYPTGVVYGELHSLSQSDNSGKIKVTTYGGFWVKVILVCGGGRTAE